MSTNLITQFPKLEIVANASTNKIRLLFLKEFSRDLNFFKAVRELIKNAANKNIKFDHQQKKKLNKHGATLKKFMHKKLSKNTKVKLVCQTGTGWFIPLALPLAAKLLTDLLKK